MTISPSDVSTLTSAQEALLTRARSIIDGELRLRLYQSGAVKIRRGIIDFMFTQNPELIDILMDEYRAAGWSVFRYSSSDQGDWYCFND